MTILDTPTETLDPLSPAYWWEQRDELEHIRNYANDAGANPAAMLVHVIMRVLAQTPHTVTLPGIIGGKQGSLNLFGALVGKSGSGKGAATGASNDGIRFAHGNAYTTPTPGSGEGLVKGFGVKKKDPAPDEDPIDWATRNVLLDAAEVTDLGGQMGRAGSTLAGQLLRAFVGESLGFSYAGDNGIMLPAHSYRLTLTAGVQPEASGALLAPELAGRGLPQRFVWAKADNPAAGDFDLNALSRQSLTLPLPNWSSGNGTVGVDDDILWTIGQNHRLNLRGTGQGLNGHTLFAQEKVAAALAFMRGSKHVTGEDWALAQDVMAHSDIARQVCIDALRFEQTKRDAERGEAESRKDEAKRKHDVDRVAKNVLRHLDANPMVTLGELGQKFNSRDRDNIALAVAQLQAQEIRFPGIQGF